MTLDADTGIERELAYCYKDDLEKLMRIAEAARAFAAVHNPSCPVASWTPESRTLRICHCGFESLRAALQSQEAGDHPYETRGPDNVCIHCGQIGSYAHTPEAQAAYRASQEARE